MSARRRYLHPFLDSDRWQKFEPRSGDIVIATPFKSGTTWMQMIVLGLLHGIKNPPLLREVGHWIDFRPAPEEEILSRLEEQSSRRFIKTHLPFDAIKYDKNIKYIVVDRDPRDVFMSLWNHYKNMDVDLVNSDLPLGVHPIPPCPDSIHEFWKSWLTKGYFEWESEGYPFWSNLRHVQSWFDVKDLDNVLHVHYNNLLLDSESEIKRVAKFIEVEISDEEANSLANYTSFESTKKNLNKLFPGGYRLFKNGPDTFFHKGKNGRWRSVLTQEDEKLLSEASDTMLSKACFKWLTFGTL
ncbi:sulfotransferase domain-containing protein [Microbulbifer sp. THAF38]|uniref:sulfotransferase domain-containing protein n=1 Tax=Microbulbifer sp. THAF38 TaxID=2587856 RepID=UPI0012A9572D|nr:sulfotransferase domain-containing protein [Microbulbifer sp. THAF38]QFT54435.1 Glycolipid sulfotransferase [Microbulbifer sp. THAF38]